MSTTTATTPDATPAATRPEPIWPRLLGMGLASLVVYWTMAAGGWVTGYIDVPSALFIALGLLGVGLAVNGGTIFTALANALRGNGDLDRSTFTRQLLALQRMRGISWGVGALGTLLGLIGMLMWHELSHPGIGAGLAFSALTLLYGGLLAELVFAPLAGLFVARSTHPEWAIDAR